MKLIVLLAVCVSARTTLAQTNYCELKSCGKIPHLACNHTGYASTCPPDRKLVTLTPAEKKHIVDLHNAFRNQIALGAKTGFKPANRMTTMLWDDELSVMATLNVKQCDMKRDTLCTDTMLFSAPGQNLAQNSSASLGYECEPNTKFLTSMIRGWFLEFKNATKETIVKCCGNSEHFTQMVQAKANRIGCALLMYWEKGLTNKLMACNYSKGNVSPVYKSVGPAASRCDAGNNEEFPGLCHPDEILEESPMNDA